MPESVPLPLKGTITNQSQLERQVADIAKKAGRNLKINLGTNAKDIKSLEQPLGRITGKADEFGKSMEAANARVIAFGASVGIINAVVQSFKSLVNTTIEVEKNLAKINSILKTTTSGLNALKGQIFDIARNTEQTFDTVAEAALELSRQGLSATEVTKRLNDALILSRLSGISAAEAVAGLTAAVNSFTKAGLTTGEVLNKISNAANQFAVSERDLIEGFKRSASVAEQAGVSIDELGGIITAVQQKTARGGAVIGNSFKTIFTRIGRAENLELLKSIGVEIQDLQGNILPATKLIENLGKQLENLDDIQVRSVTEKIGGGFQIAPLLAALSDYSSETSIAIKATEAFRNATDQAYQKNIILNQTLSAAINSTSLTIKELANSLGELGVLDPFKEILNIVNNLAKGIKELLPSKGEDTGSEFAKGIIKGLSNALIKGGLAVFGLLLFELSKNLLKFGVDSFKTFLGLNKEAEKLKNIQAQIIQTLISDKGVREQILSIERLSLTEEQKRAKQAEFFNAALRERVALTSQLNKISVGVAGGIRTRQATRRGAGGYLPIGAEQSDISKGVGGAPSGAKPVVIPNFAFGGGKRGTMVANSSEYIVPNFAGGGSAIFNQDMVKSMGLPSGAKKINAAGGFVPNFATFKFGRAKGTDFQRASAVAGSTVGQKYGGQVVTQDDINKASLFVKSNKSAQQTNRRKTYDVNVNKVLGSDIPGMLIPKLGGGRKFGKVEGSKALQSKYPGAILNATFPAFPIDLSSKKELKKEVEKTFGQGEIEKYVTDRALKIAKSIASSFALPPVEPNTINAVDNVKGFISSAVGAFGGIFDAAMTAAVGLNSTDEKGVGDFDVDVSASNAKNINKVFGRRAAARSYLDNKINQNQGISMLAKTLSTSEYRSKIEAEALTQGKKLGFIDKKTKKAARGYIPNFAMSPLEDAIQREKEAGVPINQIRVNQDGGLRNSRNPDGLAVTNTRDEPTGAIPKNASRGYVPNFAAIDLGQADARLIESINKQTKSLNKSAEITQKEAVARERSSNRMIALTFATGGLQQIFAGLNAEADGLAGKMASVGQGITGAFFTANVAESFGAGPSSLKTKTFAKSKDPAGLAVEKFLKPLGKFGSAIGRTVGLFSRLVPVIGTAVTAFSLLNPILKKFFDFDLGGEIGKLTKGLFEALNIIDTPAEKAAKALDNLQKKINDDLLSLDFEAASRGVDNFIATIQEEASGVKNKAITEGKFDPIKFREREFLNEARLDVERKTFISGRKGKQTRGFALAEGILEGKLFNEKRNISDEEEIKSFRKRIETQSLNFLTITLGNVSDELAKQLKDTSESRDIEGFQNALKKAKEDSLRNLTEEQVKLIENLEQEAIGIQFLRTKGLAQRPETGNIVTAGADSELGKQQAKRLSEILKQYKAVFNQAEDVLDVNTKILTINKKQLELQIETRKSITEIIAATKSKLEFEKSTEASLIGTSKARKFQLEEELRAVENIRKQRIESARAVEKELSSNSSIANLLKATGGVGPTDERVRLDAAKKYRDIVEKTGEQIRLNGEYDKDALKTSLEKIFTLGKQEELTKSQKETIQNIVDITTQQYEATKLILTAQQAQQALYDIEAQRKSEILRLDKQRFDVEQNRLKLQAKQDIAAKQAAKARISERQERLGILLGGGGPSSAIDLINRSAQRQQQSLDRSIERRQNIENVRQRFTETAKEEGLLGNVTVQKLLKELANGDVSQSRVKEIGLQLNQIAQLSREQLGSAIDRQAAVLKEALAGIDIKGASQTFDISVKDFRDAVREFKGLEPLDRGGQQEVEINPAQQGGGLLPTLPSAGGSNNINFAGQFGYPPLNPQTGLPDRTKGGDALDVFGVEEARELFNTSAQQESIKEVERFRLEQRALSHQKDLELIAARDQATRVSIEFQYQQYEKILQINKEIAEISERLLTLDPTSDRAKELQEQLFALERSRKFLETAELSLQKQFQSLGLTAEDATRNIKNTLVSGAEQFVNTISDGFVDAIIQGDSLGDVLRSAALDFTTQMAKAGLNNLFKQAAFGSGGGAGGLFGAIAGIFGKADGGMVSGGSGMKDDVPAVLMGGEYVMKKSAVQKYGPNFMDQLNNGILPGYANGGLVSGANRTESGLKASSWTPAASAISEYQKYRMSENEKARTQSGVLSSSWTPKADEDNVETDDKLPASEVRTESGLIASSWTKLADHRKAKASMLTGGEYVVGKKAADKFGKGFLDALNNGEIQKYANGGLVSGARFTNDEEKFRTTDIFGNRTPEGYFKRQTGGDYFAPGLYQAGNITGQRDLLGFATQGFTSGAKDFVGNVGGAQVIALEPESMRLTNFGRTQGNPLQRATQEAKGQAFDLYTGYQRDVIAWKKQVEELKKQRKAQQKAMLTNLAISFASMAIPAAGKGISNALKTGGGFSKMVSEGGLLSTLGTLGKSAFTGAPVFGGGSGNFGGMFNMFNARGGITAKNIGSYIYNNPTSKISQQLLGSSSFMSSAPKAIPVGGGAGGQLYNNLPSMGGSVLNLGGAGLLPTKEQGKRFFQNRFATGGYIPETGGIDTVSALLSGGEFVLNRAATERVGTSALQNLNSGGEGGLGGENMEELIEKLDLLIDATRENAGEINISVTGAGGGENGGGSNQATEENQATGDAAQNELRKAMAEEIKVRVLEVIRQEKRLGGALR